MRLPIVLRKKFPVSRVRANCTVLAKRSNFQGCVPTLTPCGERKPTGLGELAELRHRRARTVDRGEGLAGVLLLARSRSLDHRGHAIESGECGAVVT
jgi:hypothetical protein